MVEEVQVDQVQEAGVGGYWEEQGGGHWPPELKGERGTSTQPLSTCVWIVTFTFTIIL